MKGVGERVTAFVQKGFIKEQHGDAFNDRDLNVDASPLSNKIRKLEQIFNLSRKYINY